MNNLWRLGLCQEFFWVLRSFALLAQHTYLHLTTYSSQWYPPGANPGFSLAQGSPSMWGAASGRVTGCFHQRWALPAVSQWCSGSPWKRPGQSLCGRRCGLSAASSWQFSARGCGTWGRGCWPDCPSPREWQWPGSWLHRRDGAREPTALMRDPPKHKLPPSSHRQACTQFSWTSLSVRLGFPMWILRPAAVRKVTRSEVIWFRQVQSASSMNGFLGAQIYPYI